LTDKREAIEHYESQIAEIIQWYAPSADNAYPFMIASTVQVQFFSKCYYLILLVLAQTASKTVAKLYAFCNFSC